MLSHMASNTTTSTKKLVLSFVVNIRSGEYTNQSSVKNGKNENGQN